VTNNLQKNRRVITVADSAGFCFGVKRALDMVEALIAEGGHDIHILGPLIHNPQVMQRLSEKGVSVADTLTEVSGDVLVIRTHGVPDSVIEEAEKMDLRVVDAICPKVRHVHRLAKSAEAKGELVLLFGEPNHPEVKGIAGNLKEVLIFDSLQELQKKTLPESVCLLAQTTQSVTTFDEILEYLGTLGIHVRYHNTICNATCKRQEAAEELARHSDLVIVIGGRNSGNTMRLHKICEPLCRTIHIETVAELKNQDLTTCQKIGITAGASTPDFLVEEVIEFLKK
jgi:4-hydroxy-3-methylbut-2-enyl diphosphate reductase